MFVALDRGGVKVWAEDATKEEEYFCPVCGEPVVLRVGTINKDGKKNKIDHFAHKKGSQCPDGWHYEMSDWHRLMQESFPLECREVVFEHEGKKHRADVYKDGTVIEFQHSKISSEEFRDRNDFFMGLGIRVVWVLDVSGAFNRKRGESGEYHTGKITQASFMSDLMDEDLTKGDKSTSFKWLHAPMFLRDCPPLYEHYEGPCRHRMFSLCLSGLWSEKMLNDAVESGEYASFKEAEVGFMRTRIRKVVTREDDIFGRKDFKDFKRLKKLRLCSFPISISEDMDMDSFFMLAEDHEDKFIQDLMGYDPTLDIRMREWNIFGDDADEDCPRTEDSFEPDDCAKCRNCALLVDEVVGWGGIGRDGTERYDPMEICGYRSYCSIGAEIPDDKTARYRAPRMYDI